MSATPELPVLIYDGDCGFCTRCVRLVERLPIQVSIAAWQEVDLAALGATEERARQEVLFVDASGKISGGARAVAVLLRHCRPPWPLLGTVLSAPGARTLADRSYKWVAANRYRLPGATPACQLPADQRPGSSRHT